MFAPVSRWRQLADRLLHGWLGPVPFRFCSDLDRLVLSLRRAAILVRNCVCLETRDSSEPGYGQATLQTAVSNTAPTVAGAPSDMTATEDEASNIDLSAMSCADVDGDTLT